MTAQQRAAQRRTEHATACAIVVMGLPVGALVDVRNDNGSVTRTRTRSVPWQLGDNTWVVKLDGRPGGFAVHRLSKVNEPAFYDCGCSHHKVRLGRCTSFDTYGQPRGAR